MRRDVMSVRRLVVASCSASGRSWSGRRRPRRTGDSELYRDRFWRVEHRQLGSGDSNELHRDRSDTFERHHSRRRIGDGQLLRDFLDGQRGLGRRIHRHIHRDR